jgi:hypothetical protein
MGGLFSAISGFFGSSGFMKTANDGLRKLGGLDDLNGLERINALERILKLTQNQSPARRLIAFIVCVIWAVMVLWWLVNTQLGNVSEAIAIKTFMVETVKEPFNYIIGFYFLTNIISGIKK